MAGSGQQMREAQGNRSIRHGESILRPMGECYSIKKDHRVDGDKQVVEERGETGRIFVPERNEHIEWRALGRVAKKTGDASGFARPIISML